MVEEVEPTFDLKDPIPLKDGGWIQKMSSLILYEVIDGVSVLLLSSHVLMSMSVKTGIIKDQCKLIHILVILNKHIVISFYRTENIWALNL